MYTVYTPAAYMRRAADVMYQEKGTVCIMRCRGSHAAASAAYCDPCRRPFKCLARAPVSSCGELYISVYIYENRVNIYTTHKVAIFIFFINIYL